MRFSLVVSRRGLAGAHPPTSVAASWNCEAGGEHPRSRPRSWSIPLVRNQLGPRLFGLSRRTTGADRRSVGPTRVRAISPRCLLADERIQVADLRRERLSIRQIAAQLSRSPSTISRELRRNASTSGTYRPHEAHRRAVARRARHRQRRIESSAELFDAVSQLLGQRWSPQQISRHLTTRYPAEPAMRLCHESIYQALYQPGSLLMRPSPLAPQRRSPLRTGPP